MAILTFHAWWSTGNDTTTTDGMQLGAVLAVIGWLGCQIDSYLGALLENRGYMSKGAVNASAITGGVLLMTTPWKPLHGVHQGGSFLNQNTWSNCGASSMGHWDLVFAALHWRVRHGLSQSRLDVRGRFCGVGHCPFNVCMLKDWTWKRSSHGQPIPPLVDLPSESRWEVPVFTLQSPPVEQAVEAQVFMGVYFSAIIEGGSGPRRCQTWTDSAPPSPTASASVARNSTAQK